MKFLGSTPNLMLSEELDTTIEVSTLDWGLDLRPSKLIPNILTVQETATELTGSLLQCLLEMSHNSFHLESTNTRFLHLQQFQADTMQKPYITHPPSPPDSQLGYCQHSTVSEHFHLGEYLVLISVVSLWRQRRREWVLIWRKQHLKI